MISPMKMILPVNILRYETSPFSGSRQEAKTFLEPIS
jgi:hypothetical protein